VGFTATFAGVAVRSIDDARAWYTDFFGREPDMLPHSREAVWQVTDGGWVYVVEDAERAGNSLVTLLVDDLDSRDLDSIETLGNGTRVAVVTDPDGNKIQLGEP
jgi:catechol 2,3-dioxygenase-like lactoylglutathione lyase family enzyme